MARRRAIPPELEPEVLRRAAQGHTAAQIVEWLGQAHGVEVTRSTVNRFLARHRGGAPPAGPESAGPKGPTPARRDPKHGKQPHAICGARTKYGGHCRHKAGTRTNHPGEGRCWLHGGRSKGGPQGNKKALKSGEYEIIYADALDGGETDLWARACPDNVGAVEREIRMLTLRVRRMLLRLQTLKTRGEMGGGMVLVEQSEWSTVTDQLRDTHGRFTPDGLEGPPEAEQVSASRRRTQRSLDEALRLQEEAITRVQGRLLLAIRLRFIITQAAGPQDERDILAEIRDALANGGP